MPDENADTTQQLDNQSDEHQQDVTQDTQDASSQDQNTDSAKNALSGDHKSSSPFDSLFGEDGPELDDPVVKDWVSRQKDGVGLEKGLKGMISQMGKKGFERPPEDADDETKEAFQAKLRELQGIPDSLDDYEINFGEGTQLDEDTQKAIREFGFENDIPQSVVEKFLPFNEQFTEQLAQQHIEKQVEKGAEMFGGQDKFDQAVESLHKYLDKKGYDFEDQTFRNASAWKMLADMREMEQRIEKLTGEDTSVHGDDSVSSHHESKEALQKRQNELLFGESEDAKAFKNPGMGVRHLELRKEYLDISKKLSAIAKKG